MPSTVRHVLRARPPLSPASRVHTEGEVKDTSGKTQRVAAASPPLQRSNALDISTQSGQGQLASGGVQSVALSWGVAETDPDSSTTGAWSKPFSRRIWMVCSQVTVGSTVSGADRLSSWTLWCHHLREEGAGTTVSWAAGVENTRSQKAAPHRETTGTTAKRGTARVAWTSSPGLLLREVLLQEALL